MAAVVGPCKLLDLARQRQLVISDLAGIATHLCVATPGRAYRRDDDELVAGWDYRRAEDELTAEEYQEYFIHIDRACSVLTAILVDGGRCLSQTDPTSEEIRSLLEDDYENRSDCLTCDYELEALLVACKAQPVEYWVDGFSAAYCEAQDRGRLARWPIHGKTFVDDVLDHLESLIAPAVLDRMAADAIWLAGMICTEERRFEWLAARVENWRLEPPAPQAEAPRA
jgi:hypothetical protein